MARLIDSLRNSVTLSGPYNNVEPTAIELHKSLFVADLHADSLLWNRNLLEKADYGHVDLHRLIEGNISLQAFTVVTKVPFPSVFGFDTFSQDAPDLITALAWLQGRSDGYRQSLKERALEQARMLRRFAKQSAGRTGIDLHIIQWREDLEEYLLKRRQRIDRGNKPSMVAALLGLEDAHALEGDISQSLRELYEEGFRMMALTHFFHNDFGGSSTGHGKQGLTEKGGELITEIQRLGIVLDLAHASEKTLDDLLEMNSLPPLVVSHTGIRKTCPERGAVNLSTDHIKKIAEHGGLIGVGLWTEAVCGGVSKTVEAIEHVVKTVGDVGSVAIGADFDGGVRTHFDARGIALLTEELQKKEFSEPEIRKMMGENVRDFLLKHLRRRADSHSENNPRG
ncbi:membrane dipeptidase [Nitrospiraceae bacterium AH_259_D15_M11_P09]|nr:membrane dipeptidase [Nitrospiraceae bacterium AH_259_D15_M11_P09]